jgi:hypothetical protein
MHVFKKIFRGDESPLLSTFFRINTSMGLENEEVSIQNYGTASNFIHKAQFWVPELSQENWKKIEYIQKRFLIEELE